jgi:hypothetical protein
MKKVISSMMIAGMLIFGMTTAKADEVIDPNAAPTTELVADEKSGIDAVVDAATEEIHRGGCILDGYRIDRIDYWSCTMYRAYRLLKPFFH